jgi:hypothetical protein
MRNPYIVGNWVRGRGHYGRQALIEHLLESEESAFWLVGTRRMGKTSLLRHLELLVQERDAHWLPLYWDLEGCQNAADVSEEFRYALEEAAPRFASAGIDVTLLHDLDALMLLRKVGRMLMVQGRQLFLLIDEAEALISVARSDPAWLARLRRVLQEGRLRTVMASTKALTRLNQTGVTLPTSPFLFGFHLVNLPKLEIAAARALIRQSQAETPIEVPDELVHEIIDATNCHPYLIQYLCHKLFQGDGDEGPRLRAIQSADLTPDHILSGFFETDFHHLTQMERRLLLAVNENAVATEEDLLRCLSDESPDRIHLFLEGMERPGFLRRKAGHWVVGNEFMHRWLHEYAEHLRGLHADIDDATQEQLLSSDLPAGSGADAPDGTDGPEPEGEEPPPG